MVLPLWIYLKEINARDTSEERNRRGGVLKGVVIIKTNTENFWGEHTGHCVLSKLLFICRRGLGGVTCVPFTGVNMFIQRF
jgi:hypothetical protein